MNFISGFLKTPDETGPEADKKTAIGTALLLTGVAAAGGFYLVSRKKKPGEDDGFDKNPQQNKIKPIRERKLNTPDEWLAEVNCSNVEYLRQDTLALNGLDALAVYRYADLESFRKIIIEIENFYKYYTWVVTRGYENITMDMFKHTQQYVMNVATLMFMFMNSVIRKSPAYQHELIERQMKPRIRIVYEACNRLYTNIIRELKLKG